MRRELITRKIHHYESLPARTAVAFLTYMRQLSYGMLL
jgi:hypothetical protein